MAEVLASLKKIGGNGEEYTETVLWTNPDPTASFTGQNVTLSDSISNYKYIKFTWKTTTTDTTSSSAYVLSSNLALMTNSNGSQFLSLASLWTYVYKRNVTYNSATSIGISTCYRENASGNNNGVTIPLEILGVNELAHGIQDINIMRPDILETFTGSNSTSTKTIAVTQKPRFIMYVQGRTTQNSAIVMMFDCENETAWYYGIYNSSYRNQADTYNNYISSISDTSVTLTNFGSTTTMNQIFIYY